MKTLFVTPKATKGWPAYCPPIGLCYMKACLAQAGITDVKVLDAATMDWPEIEERIRREAPDIVGITCFTETRNHAVRLAKMARAINPRATIIMGGVHATIMHQQMLEHYPEIDLICLGEGERTILELLPALAAGGDLGEIKGLAFRRDGAVVCTPPREFIRDLDSIPFPNYDDVNLEVYRGGYAFERGRPRASILTSRGCPWTCSFCSARTLWGTWRGRSAGNTVDEMEWLARDHGLEVFAIVDDIFTTDKKRIRAICEEIVRRGLRIEWQAQTRTDCVDKSTLALMREAGCRVIQFGVESGSPTVLESLNKREDIEDIVNAFDACREVGIKAQFNVIVGAPGECRRTFEETKALLRRVKPDYLAANILRIFPATSTYELAKQQGLLDDDFWLTEKEYIYYTGQMKIAEMNALLREAYLAHARALGLRGFLELGKRTLMELKQNPLKLAYSFAPWR